MPSFSIRRAGQTVELVFDDGGMNLLSSAALLELHSSIAAIDPNVRVLALKSGRPEVFAAGADMEEMKDFSRSQAVNFSRTGQEAFDAISRLPMITVAIINGPCFGGALDLAMAFDLRWCSAQSVFSHPGARLGIITGFGGTSRWRRVLSRKAATTLFLENSVLDASDARAMGLVDEVLSPVDSSAALIDDLLSVSPSRVAFIKELARHSEGLSPVALNHLAVRLSQLHGEG
ncbi:MAG: enoyl-CoA hydratase/isomerase family protein [Acidobacteriota bacterium]